MLRSSVTFAGMRQSLNFFQISMVFGICQFVASLSYCQEGAFIVKNPLSIEPSFSGNFGELRPNHFHTGIDLKTAGREGLEVHSIADGYVSRIKISPYGYGKALYISHPGGYTTVYAHLREFAPEIESYIRKHQRELESFEIDVYPGISDLQVNDGQVVAFSGNTGGSGGPHLHFEVRETASEVPRNPLQFAFPIEDHKSPELEAIAIVPLSKTATVNGKQQAFRSRTSGNKLMAQQPISVSGKFGVEVRGYDSQDGSYNQNGIYSVSLNVDGERISQFRADSIPFDKSRHLNALIDYEYYYYNKGRYMRLFRLPGNELVNIDYSDNGILRLTEGVHEIELIASDYHGNNSRVSFSVDVREEMATVVEKPTDSLHWNIPYSYESASWSLYFPSHCVYESIPIAIEEYPEKKSIQVFHPKHPVQESFVIETTVAGASDETGWVIAQTTASGTPYQALSTSQEGDRLQAESRSFGYFKPYRDAVPPVIKNINFQNGKHWTSGSMRFIISDDFSGVYKIEAYADNRWVLASYEPKQDLVSIDVNDLPTSTDEQDFVLKISDSAGNVATFEGNFVHQ